jgi:hypothetical protein
MPAWGIKTGFASVLATPLLAEGPVWVKNAYGGRSTGTSVVPQIADDFGAPRKSAEVGHNRTKCGRSKSDQSRQPA